ncbi:MAG: catalase [Clostridia bacterium]|nr:catalase [Clostridia bacterium]
MKAIKHFITITKHRHEVIKNCKKAGILWQGLFHDLSKYMPKEFFLGAKYYQGNKSPNVGERIEKGYSEAWMHHKGRNKHHFEYWTDYRPETREYGAVKMPIRYVKEMFCDRVAASKIYKGKDYNEGYPLEYFLGGKGKRMISPETSDLLEEWLVMLKEKGEAKTFAHIRKVDNY